MKKIINKVWLFIRWWSIKRLAITATIIAVTLTGSFLTLSTLFPFPHGQMEYMKSDRKSMLLLDTDGKALRAFRGNEDSWTFWLPRNKINPHLVNAIIAAEDERFYSHFGVDPLSVTRAMLQNVWRMRRHSGASTLTMQLMRMTGKRRRTYSAKLIESFRALQCETGNVLTKDEILEWYLNLAPFGSNFYGVEAASLIYFNKHSKDLSLAEAALMAGLVQSPSAYRPDKFPHKARKRRDYVLNRLHTQNMISLKELKAALKEPVLAKRHPFPFRAPHMTQDISRRTVNDIHTTTVDSRIQSIAVNELKNQISKLPGVNNGTVVVIENKTAAVRAMVGSTDFFDKRICGEVNMATSLHPPGSTLKPFVFATTFDKGLCTPESILADVPTNFGNYYPKNYDNTFHGPVTARKALAHSYNIPPLKLLNQIGVKNFLLMLKKAGITSLTRSPSYYGLPVILGSAELSLLELTSAYTVFTNNGSYIKYRFLESAPISKGEVVMSPEAAYMVTDILTDTTRLGDQKLWNSAGSLFKFAWKTGTSYGHRSAWTIAYSPRYTVGVMVGNASHTSKKELVGISAAAPLAAHILYLIHNGKMTPFHKPTGISNREICSLSGDIPNSRCVTTTTTADYIKGVSSHNRCTLHRVKNKKTIAYTEEGTKIMQWEPEPYLAWSPELRSWFRSKNSLTVMKHRKPKIISPVTGQKYVKLPEILNQQLKLKASGANQKLFWFVNGSFYAEQSDNTDLLWPLEKGKHVITCMDDLGNCSKSNIIVN